MANLTAIETLLKSTLDPESVADYTPNGVQVRGSHQVTRVVSGVSACLALFQAAADEGAELVLTHHGLFWEKESRVVEGSMKRRLKFLLDRDMTLMSYHLPLDRHPVLGNNARILQQLGLVAGEPFGHYRGLALSRLGRWSVPRPWATVVAEVQALFGGQPQLMPFGCPEITTVAVCSGGAPELAREALAAGAELFLVGESAEPLFHFAREENLNVIIAGHHRTEKFGVMAVGDFLAQKLGIHHRFVDIDNPM